MIAPAAVRDLLDALAAHRPGLVFNNNGERWQGCACGDTNKHPAHLAEVLAPLLDEAWREGAYASLLAAAEQIPDVATLATDGVSPREWLRTHAHFVTISAAQAGPADLPCDPAGFAAEQLCRLDRAAQAGPAPGGEARGLESYREAEERRERW